jgi:hypothetical protein
MAWTTPKTWSAGETLTAANFNTHIRDNQLAMGDHILAQKTADESVSSNTTPQADDHLFFTAGTSQIWFLRLVLWCIDNGSGNFQGTVTVPAGAESRMSAIWWQPGSPSSVTTIHIQSTGGGTVWICTPSAGMVLEFNGYLTTAGTAGNWQFNWAQGTSSGSTIVLKKGSYLAGRLVP